MDTLLAYARWGHRLHPMWRVAATLLLVTLAGLIRWFWADALQGFLFVLGYPVVMVSGFLFGWLFGLFGILIHTLAVVLFFIEPVLGVELHSPEHIFGAGAFVLGASAAVVLIERLVQMIERLEEAVCAQRALVAEKALLLRELNHRVKNNLQAINAMLTIHRTKLSSEEAREALQAATERIAVVGRIHDRLYQQDGPLEALKLNADELLRELCAKLSDALLGDQPITFHVAANPVPMSVGRATLVGLLVNELVTNSLKHAFPDNRAGLLTVRLERSGNRLCLVVADDGVGCPQTHADGIGLTLVEALASQLQGTVRREDAEPGCRVTITIPAVEPPH